MKTRPAQLSAEESEYDTSAEVYARRMEASIRLRATRIKKAAAVTELEDAERHLEKLVSSHTISLPIVTQHFADALVLADVTTTRRAWWRQFIRAHEREATNPRSNTNLLPLLTDLDEDEVNASHQVSESWTATVLQLRGRHLRVASGDASFRCWVDIPVGRPGESLSYHSQPFRAIGTNLHKLLFSLGSGPAALHLGTTFEMTYSALEGTISFPFRQGPISVSSARLKDATAFELDADRLERKPFNPIALSQALLIIYPSVPVPKGARSPFAWVQNGTVIASRTECASIYRDSRLEGLDFAIDQPCIETLALLLQNFDVTSSYVTLSDEELIFSDDVMTVALQVDGKNQISGIERYFEQWQSEEAFEVQANGLEVYQGLKAAMLLSDHDDTLTRVNLEYRIPAHEPRLAFADAMAASTIADMRGLQPAGPTLQEISEPALHLKLLTTHERRRDCTPTRVEVISPIRGAEFPGFARKGQAVDIRQLKKAIVTSPDVDNVGFRFQDGRLGVFWSHQDVTFVTYLAGWSNFQSALCHRYEDW